VLREAVKQAICKAIEAMDAMCLREGEAIAADLLGRCKALREILAVLSGRVDEVREAVRKRLKDRIDRLLAEREIAVDPSRLEAEVVLLADRGDVTEELTRLGSHLEQFEGVAAMRGQEPTGRRLDFLLQEMVREANTLGAKAQDAVVSHEVVAVKVELERLREQVQNIE
jgi:uncharacterized protein (TIGR00255 family)